MALVLHRRTPAPDRRPSLILVGGEGRWARPLLRLVETFGFDPRWAEDAAASPGLRSSDLVIAASPRIARELLASRDPECAVPVVVITGSLLGLSTAVTSPSVLHLPWPITRDSLEAALQTGTPPGARAA